MKSTTLFILLFAGVHFCHAQDTLINLSPSMFVGDQEIPIAVLKGWHFHEGHDTAWAAKGIDLSDWRKMRPVDLRKEMAGKNGKVEGWFRLRFKPDTTFGKSLAYLRFYCWAATDLYIDGKFIQSFGNTGADGHPYQEFNPNERLPIPVDLAPGREHLIAFHFVDQLSPFPGHVLKSQRAGLQQFIKLTGPYYYETFSSYLGNNEILLTFQLSITGILSLLFWLMVIQNPTEKNLWLISVFTTLNTCTILFNALQYGHSITFLERSFYEIFYTLSQQLSVLIIPMIIVNIFHRKLIWDIRVFLFLLLVLHLAGILLPDYFAVVWSTAGTLVFIYYLFSVKETLRSAPWTKVAKALFVGLRVFMGITLSFAFGIISRNIPLALWITVLIIFCMYEIIYSWKTIKGAQWAIVVGLCLTVLWLLSVIIANGVYKSSIYPYNRLYSTGTLLSFPLALLVYVAMRLKEHIDEVKKNADIVLQLSEEKKEQALNREKILQEEVARQTAEIRNTLDNLKTTQHQLIQSEKMASLGELTAGIAHEIQNPLNFVNNFSEVNSELIHEMKKEIEIGNLKEANTLASAIDENEQKIIFHGKRADAIVKGMLQHSRSSSGVKEPTDINVLADEYLRLAYHGLRAKDKSFNAKFETAFDNSIGKVSIIPQDIGRVVLNLITNAFYSVSEKKKTNPDTFEPIVLVTTEKINGRVAIKVKDNGNGIPQKVLDKIFQPFFTTKPAGQGTGLGLSLSYDIVKAHAGELSVETKEGIGAEFIIQIPFH